MNDDVTLRFDRADTSGLRSIVPMPIFAVLAQQAACTSYDPCAYDDYIGDWQITPEQEAEFPNATAQFSASSGTVSLYPNATEVTIEFQIGPGD